MSEPAPEQRLVTDREIDLTIIEADERFITVTVAYREFHGEEKELGDYLGTEPRRFPIRGALPVPLMTAFLRLETRINNALQRDDEEADRELEATMEDAHARIVGLIIERSPSVFDLIEPGEKYAAAVKPVIELDVSQILILLAWIAGDTSVADAVTKVLTAGRTQSKQTAEEIAATAAGDDAELEEGAATAAPFGSNEP